MMSKIYLIADTHFYHTNIIKYCKRPFKDTYDMNKTIIDNWNRIVKPNDIVLTLGAGTVTEIGPLLIK